MAREPKDVDEYIAAAPPGARAKLERMRKAIREAAPGAAEGISYKIPFYSLKGQLAWFGLQSRHIGLYLHPPVIQDHRKELAGFVTTKSAVHIPLDGPVPVGLVKKLVKARLRINEAGD